MKQEKDWKKLENDVLTFSSILYGAPAKKENIEGIDFDAVIHLPQNQLILIEVTRNFTLDKIRGDINRLSTARMNLFLQGQMAQCILVIHKEPTTDMETTANGAHIQLLSYEQFVNQVIDFEKYITLRSNKVFGSAINPSTGESDTQEYIPATYLSENGKKTFSIEDLCETLSQNNKIILLGEYGTGKSRCTKEIFAHITQNKKFSNKFILSINLREHWGAGTAEEIIVGHLKRVGFEVKLERILSLLESGKFILVLDGFDEVGSQTFGNSPEKRLSIRIKALQGVRELISLNKGGVLVTGRPHYFNSHEEMLDCLGLSVKDIGLRLIKCAEEFNDTQTSLYLSKLGVTTKCPIWLPKKPLIFNIISLIPNDERIKILENENGELPFWGQFLDAVCEREARIHSSINSKSVRNVLIELAKITRFSDFNLGRLTPKDFNECYEKATGTSPDEAGQLMLSRLCMIGRIEPESPDRQFVDKYVLQLLFAENIFNDISYKNEGILQENWKQRLDEFGISVLASWIQLYDLLDDALSLVFRMPDNGNSQAIIEILSALSLLKLNPIDLSGLQLKYAQSPLFSLGNTLFKNIKFYQCIFDKLTFENCLIDDSAHVIFDECMIDIVTGFAAEHSLPKWLVKSSIDNKQNTSNSSRIKDSNLPTSQKLLLSIIQKIFFQSGGGRQEDSLYKGGYQADFDKELIDSILKYLVQEGYITKSKDSSKNIYNPNRYYTERMRAIKDQLSLSKDPIWLDVLEFQSKMERKRKTRDKTRG